MVRFSVVILLFLAFFSCGSKKNDTKDTSSGKNDDRKIGQINKTQNTGSDSSALNRYDISGDSPKIVELPQDLIEISGITFTDDERLFAQGDEDGDVFQVDYNTGKIIKKFSLGNLLVIKGDFEDIAFVKDRFFMLESKGKLYEFKEGEDGRFVDYKTYKTFLNSSNNTEGLCYDPETNALLLACKDSPGKDYKKEKAVYSFSLGEMILDETPRFLISNKDIKNNSEEGKFNPSGIARHPLTGTFFIIAARGNTIIELSKDGRVLNQKDLPESVHRQAEGIAFKKDGTLFISNEGRSKSPEIVIYPMKK